MNSKKCELSFGIQIKRHTSRSIKVMLRQSLINPKISHVSNQTCYMRVLSHYQCLYYKRSIDACVFVVIVRDGGGGGGGDGGGHCRLC